MTESVLSDEADALYRPLEGVEAWGAAGGVDPDAAGGAPPAGGDDEGDDGRAWAELLARGALLAAAHQSGVLDGMHDGGPDVALALLRGRSSVADLDEGVRAHVRANLDALGLAQRASAADLSAERWLRTVHATACRPQLTHPVRSEDGVQDHVLATGELKHHPNHARDRSGRWVAHAPVAELATEMGRFLENLGREDFATLPAVTRAAYAHHGLTHVAPFADGNGRVARVLAGAHLLRQASVPFLVLADQSSAYEEAMAAAVDGAPAALVAFVGQRAGALVDLLGELRAAGPSTSEEVAAVARWAGQNEAGAALAGLLPGAVDRALDRHRRRPDLGWLSPLTDAVAGGVPLVVGVPGVDVAEVIAVDTHPLADDGAVVLRAEEARLQLRTAPPELVPAVSDDLTGRLEPWLDRVMSTLALRVAAELD